MKKKYFTEQKIIFTYSIEEKYLDVRAIGAEEKLKVIDNDYYEFIEWRDLYRWFLNWSKTDASVKLFGPFPDVEFILKIINQILKSYK